MKTEEYTNGKTDREILTAMVVDRVVLGSVAAKWDGKLFPSQWANRLAGWCVHHYEEYHKAPNKAIGSYFDRWAERRRDPDEVSRMEEFLAYLDGHYNRNGHGPDSRYVVDLAAKRFTSIRLKANAEKVLALADEDVDKATEAYEAFRRVDIGSGAGVSVLEDFAAVDLAFKQRGKVLIRFNQPALDRFFATALAKEEFICFVGMEKIGKSFILQEVAYNSVLCGHRTAFFELGDQSQNQILRRIAARAARHPHILLDKNPIRYPVKMDPPPDGRPESLPDVGHDMLEFGAALTALQARKALKALAKRTGPDLLRLSCHAAESVSILDVDNILDDWARDGWRPDTVVFDYMDIFAPINGKADTRDQINATWKSARGLNLKRNVLLVSATQTNKDGYDADILTRSNFSEDKRKNSHVTGMCGINQRPDEKERGVYRLNWTLLRDLDFSEETCVRTASCLAVANPFVLSTL